MVFAVRDVRTPLTMDYTLVPEFTFMGRVPTLTILVIKMNKLLLNSFIRIESHSGRSLYFPVTMRLIPFFRLIFALFMVPQTVPSLKTYIQTVCRTLTLLMISLLKLE